MTAAHASAARTPSQPCPIDHVVAQAARLREARDSDPAEGGLYEIVYRQPFPLERQAVAGVPAVEAVAMMTATLSQYAPSLPADALRTQAVGGDRHRCWVVLADTGTRIALFIGLGPDQLAALLSAPSEIAA